MTDTHMDDAGMGELAPAEEQRERALDRLGEVTTTTLVHRGARGSQPWWQQAVVYQVLGTADLDALAAMSAGVSHVARLGANALLIRVPAVSPDDPAARDVVEDFLRRAHQRGIRVIVSFMGTDEGGADRDGWHLARASAWVAHGVDGIDLGVSLGAGEHGHAGIDLGALHALVADADAVLTGAVTAREPEALAEHLHEDWLHVTRDDRLAVTPWEAAPLRATISDSYLQRDAVGAPAGWTLTDLTHASAPSWGLDPEAAGRRRRAATLLMAALPGTTYVPQGEAVGLAPRPDDPAGTIAEVARLADEQRGVPGSAFERYRQALRLRRELSLGTGPLAWVDDAPGPETLAFLNREVLVLTNLSERDVLVPVEREILHASDELLGARDGVVNLPPDTTVWISLA
ncbi:hypothetical protein [Georgenia daeguensis]|uniref:hypothetical protein n=1 Tax=Georgenia daeguensis TaxID=908355 RepID=UPI0031F0D150